MRRVFVEAPPFTKRIDREGRETLLLIQEELLERLESGLVIPGAGGLRKLRVSNAGRGKGKRGGYRVIYLDVPETKKTYLLGLYGKGDKADLSHDEKNILKRVVERLKREVR